MILRAAIACAAIACVTPAIAQNSVPDQPAATAQPDQGVVDPIKQNLARDILEITHALDNSRAGIDRMIPLLVAQLRRDKAEIPDAVIARFTQIVQSKLEASLPSLLDAEADIFARHYTADELRDIKAFYQTDTGKKLIAQTPLIIKEVFPVAQVWGYSAGAQAMKDTLKELRAEGVKI